ncbi:hypothetical protein ACIBEA_30350 [Streptomyces sp. NPDC051555]|uniref:hypothetical protein n=1 Tax=Streptomyces sp. NPDC051555 TaxID=3365657 RepID=UPI0037AD3387
MGVVLAAGGWWADWSGYPVTGLVLSLLAGAVVVTEAWRSGALERARTAPSSPHDARPRARPSVERADQECSLRLLRAFDDAAETGTVGELSVLERVVLDGVAALPGRE